MRTKFLGSLSIAAILTIGATTHGATLSFTGNVGFDFGGAPTVVVTDPVGDVGMPANAPAGSVSGWEISEVVFYYDLETDMLQIGLDTYGIAGDADGDGIDGSTPQWLLDNGGMDFPDLMSSESMGIAFDFDRDGTYDLIAGVSALDYTHRVCQFDGSPVLPFFAFGTEMALHDGGRFYFATAQTPDYELNIAYLSQLTDTNNGNFCFDFLAFGGSFEDDGVGEEFVEGTACFENTPTLVEVPRDFAVNAYPNPFNPTTIINFSLTEAGQVSLQVFDVNGHLVNTLVDGFLPVGDHRVTFDASNLASGMYLARIQTAAGVKSVRLLLMK